MLCIKIYSDTDWEPIVVTAAGYGDAMSVYADTQDGMEVSSDSDSLIVVTAELHDGIAVSADTDDFIEVSSEQQGFIKIWAVLDKGIVVTAEADDFMEVNSWTEVIEVTGEGSCGMDLYARYEFDPMDIEADGAVDMSVYASYVCTLHKDGYLYIEPETIWVSPNFFRQINVISNMTWEITN